MIPRYECKEITDIWCEKNRYQKYLEAELAILAAQEKTKDKNIPIGTALKIQNIAKINVERVHQIEAETRHDIIAFCSMITEQISPKISKFFHFGVTSSDIIDTAQSLQIRASLDYILLALEDVLISIYQKAEKSKGLLCLGRSHGMYAEPMSFAAKWLSFHAEFKRRQLDLKSYYESELTGQFSGAVGNYTVLTPEEEQIAVKSLGLKVEDVSTQIIPRDRIAKLIQITSLLACGIERLAVEIRHLHRSDVGEIHEGMSKGQKGSSTMPHKKNPISSENLTGMARFLRSHASMALENTILWHERDISHSAPERMYLPDHFGILLYSLKRLKSTIDHLVIHREKIEERVQSTYSYLSSFYLHHLLLNCHDEKITRENLYKIVQNAAFKSEEESNPILFKEVIEKELGISLPIMDWDNLKKCYLKAEKKLFSA